jgi:hypothetical protein
MINKFFNKKVKRIKKKFQIRIKIEKSLKQILEQNYVYIFLILNWEIYYQIVVPNKTIKYY